MVKDCYVDLGKVGQFGLSANAETIFENCTVIAARGFYNDTGDTKSAVLRKCKLSGSYAAISVAS